MRDYSLRTDLTELLQGNSVRPDQGTAEHPVDPSLIIRPDDIAWSANPIVALRPLGSDVNTARRGKCHL